MEYVTKSGHKLLEGWVMISSKSLHLPINSMSLQGTCSPPAEYHRIPVGETSGAWLKAMTHQTIQKNRGAGGPLLWSEVHRDVHFVVCSKSSTYPLQFVKLASAQVCGKGPLVRTAERRGDCPGNQAQSQTLWPLSVTPTHGTTVPFRLDQVSRWFCTCTPPSC